MVSLQLLPKHSLYYSYILCTLTTFELTYVRSVLTKGHQECCQCDSLSAIEVFSFPSHVPTCTCICMYESCMFTDHTKLTYICSGHTNVVSCCAFSHNNHWLLTGSWDKNLHLHNVANGTYRHVHTYLYT